MKKQTKNRTKRNESVVRLRDVLGMTQSEFAKLIGVSLIAIKKIECGSLPLSGSLANRIYFQTGVSPHSLKDGDGKLLTYDNERTFERKHFESWRKMFNKPERVFNDFDKIICPHMLLLLMAAARPAIGGKIKDRLAGLMDSWAKWEKEAVEAFGLEPQITDLLKRLEKKFELTKTWGEWRQLYKEGEQTREAIRKQHSGAAKNYVSLPQQYGFKDNPRKKDDEKLTLTTTSRFYFATGLYGFPADFVNELRTLT